MGQFVKEAKVKQLDGGKYEVTTQNPPPTGTDIYPAESVETVEDYCSVLQTYFGG